MYSICWLMVTVNLCYLVLLLMYISISPIIFIFKHLEKSIREIIIFSDLHDDHLSELP